MWLDKHNNNNRLLQLQTNVQIHAYILQAAFSRSLTQSWWSKGREGLNPHCVIRRLRYWLDDYHSWLARELTVHWIPTGTYFLAPPFYLLIHYLRQVNEVNGGDNVFVRCVSVCLCVRSGRSWELKANSSKTVKATDFKFDTRVPRDCPDMTSKISPKGGVARVTWPPKFLGDNC